MKTRCVALTFLLIFTMWTTTGCAVLLLGAGAAAGAGAVAYSMGDLETTEEASFEETYTASIAGLEDMGYGITKRSRDVNGTSEATIEAKKLVITQKTDVDVDVDEDVDVDVDTETSKDDETVTVKLKEVTDNVTEMSIRVGTFGDEAKSRQILEKIREKL